MMFKLALISVLVVASYCMPADKDKPDHLEQPEPAWNSAWAHPSAANPIAAGAGAWQNQWGAPNSNWNRWNNPAGAAADSRWNHQNRWGATDQPRNRWGAVGSPSGSQWNRPGAWSASGAAPAAATRWNSQ